MRRVCCVALLALCLSAFLTSLPCTLQAQGGDQEYTPEEIKSIPTETFLQLMAKPQPGYDKFAAMRALIQKAKDSNANTRWSILNLVILVMYDKNRTEYQRFQCCYVISGSGDERGVQYLVDILFNDPSATMRSVAAEALGGFKFNDEARDALVKASKKETNAKVLEVINKYLSAGDGEYTPEQIANTSVETFLQRIEKPEPGYDRFAAMRALGRKAKESDPQTRRSILDLVVSVINERTRTENLRFQCCYVISTCGDEQWVQPLIDVLFGDPSATMRSVAAEALGGFPKSTAAKNALIAAAQSEKNQKVLDVINKYLNRGTAEYTAEQIASTSAETFLERMEKPEPGYERFAALRALGKKAKGSNEINRTAILSMVVAAMNDKSRSENQRFQCCYVISDCGDEQWIKPLIDVLFNDPSSTMRSVAAEALGMFKNSTKARNALVQASRTETNQKVLDVLNRILSKADAAS